MAAAIKKQMGLEADLIEGSGGILEVQANGALVYTNKGDAAEQYPGDDGIVKKLKSFSASYLGAEPLETSDSSGEDSTPSCTIEPPPVVRAPAPEHRTDIDRMSFACNCAPVTGPEGCTCHN